MMRKTDDHLGKLLFDCTSYKLVAEGLSKEEAIDLYDKNNQTMREYEIRLRNQLVEF